MLIRFIGYDYYKAMVEKTTINHYNENMSTRLKASMELTELQESSFEVLKFQQPEVVQTNAEHVDVMIPANDVAVNTNGEVPHIVDETIPTIAKIAMTDTVVASPASSRRTSSRQSSKQSSSREKGSNSPGIDPVAIYLKDIGKVPLLTKEDETRLSIAIKAGKEAEAKLAASDTSMSSVQKRELKRLIRKGDAATDEFIEANLRLVVSIAKRYLGKGLELADLVQEGNLGVMRAVQKFDHKKGFKFSTYATWWIRQSVERGIANSGRAIRLPVHAGDQIREMQKARFKYMDEFGMEPSIAELAQLLFIPEEKVFDLLLIQRETLSLEEPIGEDHYIGDTISDKSAEEEFEKAISKTAFSSEISKLLEPLNDKERQVITFRFGLEDGRVRTLEEVGEEFNLTRERIRQIQEIAIHKMQHPELHGDSSIVDY